MREALAYRDVVAVYRILQRYGMSQRAIAARTGQAQSDVSDILLNKRRVTSYEVLARIAEGFQIPPGWLGLAYDDETVEFLKAQSTDQ
jgi:transcriptional regulator with XRE-family HTH domain